MARTPAVVIVDQDADARYQLRGVVKQAGFDVAGEAGLGTEGVSLASDARPEMVLCGLREPMARVVQTIESLAHNLPEIPIVAYADSADIAVVRQAMGAGARDFLQTPVKPEDIQRALGTALESQERRRLRESGVPVMSARGTIITVFGAKGGVGKTTLATNLAVAFARKAKMSTVLVDADDTFGDAASALSIRPEASVIDALRQVEALDGDTLKKLMAYHDSGLGVLGSPNSPFDWKGLPGERLEALLQQLARQYDVVLVDTGNSLSDACLTALECATMVFWVTTPDYASVRDSLQALQALRGLRVDSEKIRLVLNVVSPDLDVRPQTIEEALGASIFWTVPYDRTLRRASQGGQAVIDASPHSAAAETIAELALTLSGRTPEPVVEKSLLQRLLRGRNGSKSPEPAVKEEAKT
jgi:pilus assembly protein CpaE